MPLHPPAHPARRPRASPARLRAAALWAAAVLALAAADLRAEESRRLSRSKLSVHLINAYTEGAARVVAARPRVLKILDTHEPMLRAAREYKKAAPRGTLVLRVYTRVRYAVTDDPRASARDFWYRVLQPAVARLPRSDRRLIDYLEGPNEGDSTPTWASLEEARWLNSFWLELAPLIRKAGFRPCIGSVAVGNPGGDERHRRELLDAFAPALRRAKQLGGAWSYHAYTIQYTTDPGREIWYSLRYRLFYDHFREAHPDLITLPLILTEGGVDESGSPTESGWQARGSAERYQQWLTWFDRELRRDPYVVGCTLFQLGDPGGWRSFDLEPLTGWLAGHLSRPGD